MTSSDDSGPIEFPRFEQIGPAEPAAPPSSAEPTSNSNSSSSSSRRRGVSGSSLLAKLPFLRTSEARATDGLSSSAPTSAEDDRTPRARHPHDASSSSSPGSASPVSPVKNQMPALNLLPQPPSQQPPLSPGRKKPRSRKDSLRKAALLATGRVLPERRSQHTHPSPAPVQPDARVVAASPSANEAAAAIHPLRHDQVESPHLQWPAPHPEMHEGAEPQPRQDYGGYLAGQEKPRQHGHLYTSSEDNPVPKTGRVARLARHEVSTTDEDDEGTLDTSKPRAEKHDASYFSAGKPGILRHRGSKNTMASSTGALPMDAAAAAAAGVAVAVSSTDEWDYAATEWWGWVILVLTWMVFVVGMGSCFEVWSWAWDVGETPYAPPELEDDATLPIVGYYPALIILTGVMAWVWVTIAWVGMKYFRHAKIPGEDA